MGNTPVGQVELERLRSRLLTIFFALVAGFVVGRWNGARIRPDWANLFVVAAFGLMVVVIVYVFVRNVAKVNVAWGRSSWFGPFQGVLNQFHLSAWCFVALGAGNLLRHWGVDERIGLVPLSFGIGLALGTHAVNRAEAANPVLPLDPVEESIVLQWISWLCGMLVLTCALLALWDGIGGGIPWVRLPDHRAALALVALLLVFALFQLPRTYFPKAFWLAGLAFALIPCGVVLGMIGLSDPVAWLFRLQGRYPLKFVGTVCMPLFAYAYWAFRCAAQRR